MELIIRTFDIAEDASMLGTLMHQVNLVPMFEKWPHSEWTRWW
jgi:hypothetical protein